jgi:sugar lactone lactonase YvrE
MSVLRKEAAMSRTARNLFLALAVSAASAVAAAPVSFSTLVTTPLVIEGLTNDDGGNLYAPGRHVAAEAGQSCPIYRISLESGTVAIVGIVPAPSAAGFCSPSGLAFGPNGLLYVTETDKIYRLAPSEAAPPTATLFATGIPGTNGLAFDRDGNLWTGDGTTGQGRVWKIPSDGTAQLMFRVQPMANSLAVGRSAVTLPPASPQPLVANGLQFTAAGDLLIADTARGAIWKVAMNRDGSVAAPMGCDTTFSADTLCLDNVMVAHPLLDGADGFVLDVAGNLWVSANERNAVIFVSAQGDVQEVFRNPPAATGLRNEGPLESPTSPALVGTRLCTANSDGNRRDNSPNTAGEIKPAGPERGKISCMDQRATLRGARLPVR